MKKQIDRKVKLLRIRILIYMCIAILVIAYLVLCNVGAGLSCFIYDATGILCHSCGATRALIYLLSFDFATAINMHPVFTLVLYPALTLLLAQDFLVAVYNVAKKKDKQSLLTFVFRKQVDEEE